MASRAYFLGECPTCSRKLEIRVELLGKRERDGEADVSEADDGDVLGHCIGNITNDRRAYTVSGAERPPKRRRATQQAGPRFAYRVRAVGGCLSVCGRGREADKGKVGGRLRAVSWLGLPIPPPGDRLPPHGDRLHHHAAEPVPQR